MPGVFSFGKVYNPKIKPSWLQYGKVTRPNSCRPCGSVGIFFSIVLKSNSKSCSRVGLSIFIQCKRIALSVDWYLLVPLTLRSLHQFFFSSFMIFFLLVLEAVFVLSRMSSYDPEYYGHSSTLSLTSRVCQQEVSFSIINSAEVMTNSTPRWFNSLRKWQKTKDLP